jgi:hypothetical protein
MCIDEKQLGQLITRLDNVEKDTAKTVESLYGDGKPGLMERVGKIDLLINNAYEQSKNNNIAIERASVQATIVSEKAIQQAAVLADKAIKQAERLAEKTEIKSMALIRKVNDDNLKLINEIKTSIETIGDSVTKHHDDKELHTYRLFIKKDVLAWTLITLLVLHSFIPANTDVFELIKKIFGL